jgi:DNA-directed RNA polymerase subunit beta'
MAVHLPLSIEAQVEAHTLIMATNNIFAPSSGAPMLSPSQDIVLGNFYITHMADGKKGEGMLFRDPAEAITAMDMRKVDVHAVVKVRLPEGKISRNSYGDQKGRVVETTAGRCLFNDILPEKMPFYNMTMDKKQLGRVIHDCFELCGSSETIDLLDNIKELGFKRAALAGMSFGVTDLRIPDEKVEIIEKTQKRVEKVMKNYQNGILTEGERYNQIIDAWTHARVEVTNAMMNAMKNDTRDGKPYLNPIWVMRHSGARGSIDQIQQLAGMRALMANPSCEVMETPILSNFREGLNVLEYFTSTHGARKGLADTALKTADSGYLTRKLADVAQNVMISEIDCGTLQGITKTTVYKGESVDIPLKQLIIGRTARDNIRNLMTDEMIVRENEIITSEAADKIEQMGLDAIRVRSPLTCESQTGVCAKCYGWDLSTSQSVEEGMAVGIIAAQSIGEPGTQLTMRTFHTGGIASVSLIETDQKAPREGKVKYIDLNVVEAEYDGKIQMISLRRNGEIALLDEKDRELTRFKVPYGGLLQVKDEEIVKAGKSLFSWDPHRIPILAEVAGFVRLVDVIEGETMRVEEERKGQQGRPVVIEHKGDKHPQVMVENAEGKILDVHYLPAKARIEVEEGQEVGAGTLLARLPRGSGGTQDITGGLPRVTEIFEARKPKDPAAMAEISGAIELKSDKRRGKMTIIVRNEETGMEKDHHVPRDRHLNYHTGDHVDAGDALTDGPLVPHDILRIKGEEALQRYLLREVQNVYRAQSVNINDKHIEVILSQMMNKVEIENVGDGPFLPGEVVDKLEFRSANAKLSQSLKIVEAGDTDLEVGQLATKQEIETANEKAEMLGGEPAKGKKPRPATANTLLLGITKASLQSDSFLSAASFQETTKVLTEASLSGTKDPLCGLKENIILGHLIPAGTAFKPYLEMQVKHLAEAPVPKVLEELRDVKEADAAADKAVKAALGLE